MNINFIYDADAEERLFTPKHDVVLGEKIIILDSVQCFMNA